MEIIPYKPRTCGENSEWEVAQLEHHILRQRREELGLTMQQVADRANILLCQYQRLERGERNMSSASARIMLSICDALKLDPYLFVGSKIENIQMEDEKQEMKYLVLPPVETNGLFLYIPEYAYFLLVSQIPYGKVTTLDIIEEVLKKAYSFDSFNLRENMNGVNLALNDLYPHWRVLSSKGFLIETQNSTKESQKEKLNSEGIAVKKSETVRAYNVPNYARLLYRFEDLIITVMKSEKQIMMEYQAYVEEQREKLEDETNT